MVADYEAAWVELGGLISQREGWGSRALAAEMARLLARHRLTEPQIERVLRLYGGRVAIVMQTPEAPANGHGGTPTGSAPAPGQTKDQEVRDEGKTTNEQAPSAVEEEERGAPGGLTDAPKALRDAAAGAAVGDEGERDVLSYLLGATHRPEYTVTAQLDTPAGVRELRFRLEAQDDRTMERIDAENRSGEGPFAKLDRSSFNAALLAAATRWIEDPVTGAKIELDDKRFLGSAPSIPSALEARFRFQPGLLDGLAEQVRQISGYNPERVGTAQRVVAAAVSN